MIYDPSGKFRYSNIGPILAAIIAEKVTGKSWKKLTREYIFEPLRMENSGTNVSDFDIDKILPSLTISSEGRIIERGFYKKDVTMHASGGIISTVNDLAKWLSANIRQDKKLLSKESWKRLHSGSVSQNRKYFSYSRNGYSPGWDIAVYRGDTLLTRFGSYGGIMIHISFMPSVKKGIIAFTNDNRAYLLPHLVADYAYNRMNHYDADSIFQKELKIFKSAFEKENNIDYSSEYLLLPNEEITGKIIGYYKNNSGWPIITITKEKSNYLFKWGALSGKIYSGEKNNLSSRLGPLNRKFRIVNDTLFNGSLVYIKKMD